MVRFNSENLKNIINNLNKIISQYEENQLNLFNELKESFNNWQDGNSILLEGAVYLDNVESDNIIGLMKEYKDALVFVLEKYGSLGKTVSCNLNSKSSLIKIIEKYEEEITNIINQFYEIDNTFYYEEYQNILNQKEKIEKSKIQLLEFHNEMSQKFNKIEKIENDIKLKIEEIEILKINSLDYQLTQNESDIKNNDISMLKEDALEKNMTKIELYVTEEKKYLNNYVNQLENLNNGYTSTNIDSIKKNIEFFKANIDFIFEKRNEYLKIFKNTIIKYNDLSNYVSNKFSKESKNE